MTSIRMVGTHLRGVQVAEMKRTIASLRQARRQLVRLAKDMPDHDAYAMAYCIAVDTVEAIDAALKDLSPSMREAKKELRQHPDWGKNHAKPFTSQPKEKKK